MSDERNDEAEAVRAHREGDCGDDCPMCAARGWTPFASGKSVDLSMARVAAFRSIWITSAEERAIHLARTQYEVSARRYADEGNRETAAEHYKLADTLVEILKRSGYYPATGAA